ncbi:MAG: hypothetical protein M3Y13_00645 [Armatimonadota bacterium]|nr:hypothetical protein [Armatimonadota bacterium]
MQLQPLAQYLLAENKSVLLLDACCLLDGIRGPARGRMADFEAAVAMAAAIDQGNLPFQIALPSPVSVEAQAHVADARGVVTTHLQQHDATNQVFRRVHQALGLPSPLPPVFPPLNTNPYEDFLEAIYWKIIKACHVIDDDPIFQQSARRRIAQGRRPGRRGSNKQFNDCRILEESLALGAELRQYRFKKRIVFGSSNIADFSDAAKSIAHPDIAADLAPLHIEYAASLQEAHEAVLHP